MPHIVSILLLAFSIYGHPPLPGVQDSTLLRKKEAGRMEFNFENAKTFLFQHINYPKEAYYKEIKGTVLVGFIITKQGNVDSVRLIKSAHPLLDEEALKLIRNMPLWKPILINGEPATVYHEIPVIFEIVNREEEDKKTDTIQIKKI